MWVKGRSHAHSQGCPALAPGSGVNKEKFSRWRVTALEQQSFSMHQLSDIWFLFIEIKLTRGEVTQPEAAL